MPRRKISSNESKLLKGRGQGHGINYTPFLYTREVPSLGQSTRIKGWKTGRVHHFLSTLETNYFLTLEWAQNIVDIREQFPLIQTETLKIAERLSIKHPSDIKIGKPTVMTTDFLIDIVCNGDRRMMARTVKYSNDLNDQRTIEKFEIERTYWKEQGVDWGIVTEFEIPAALAHNISWLHSAIDSEDAPGITTSYIPYLEREIFTELAAKPECPLAQTCMASDAKLGLKGGTALWAVRHFIATRQWEVDMLTKIEPQRPLTVTRAVLAAAQQRV